MDRRIFLQSSVLKSALTSASAISASAISAAHATGSNLQGPPYEIIDVSASPMYRWANGKGFRREVAAQVTGAGDGTFKWRIGLAYCTADAAFPNFPGVDRAITLMSGAGLVLQSPGMPDFRLDRQGFPFHFRGEMPIESQLIGSTSEIFNIMVDRELYRADLQLADNLSLPKTDAVVLLYNANNKAICQFSGRTVVLLDGQALLWRAGCPGVEVQKSHSNDRSLYVVKLVRRELNNSTAAQP